MDTTPQSPITINAPPKFPLIPILIALTLILASNGVTYYLTRPAPLKPVPISTPERVFEEGQSIWKSLVIKRNIEFFIKGKVTNIEEGYGPKNSEIQEPGRYLTLKNGTDEHVFFVSTFSDWMEGDYEDYFSWERSAAKIASVGDIFVLQGNVLVKDTSTADSFRAFWVFKDLK